MKSFKKRQQTKLKVLFLFIYFILCGYACIESKDFSSGYLIDNKIPYNLLKPDHYVQLPPNLKEISGVAYYQENQLLCCEDESGKVYSIDMQKGNIIDYFDFGKKGDYEDLTLAPNKERDEYHIYVLRTDKGNLYRINNLGEKNQKVKKYKTFLKKRHNAEGLCYLPMENLMLLACKNQVTEQDSLDNQYKNFIYAFDVYNKKIINTPYLILNALDIEKAISPYRLLEYPFQPSAIGQRPGTDHLYILSSVNQALLIMTTKGEILNFYSLPKNNFPQPEGLCFTPQGVLIISNEGKLNSGSIQFFYVK